MISIVIPIYNEQETISELYSRLNKVFSAIGEEFEAIFINDGSTDTSLETIRNIHNKDKRLKAISFSRNFGHQAAITAGLRYASGDCVVVMDADLQDQPEIITEMVKKWRQGFEVVYGIRQHRKEPWITRVCYEIFYSLLYKISPSQIPRNAGDFCLMDKRVVIEMRRLNEERPFVRGLRHWVGFKQAGIEYDRAARITGKSKYNIIKLFGLALDGILSFSSLALRMATVIGLIVSLISICYAFYIGINRILIAIGFVDTAKLVPGWATLVCSITFLLGLQFIFLGILGEYVGRIFAQVKARPLFIVDEEVGFGNMQ